MITMLIDHVGLAFFPDQIIFRVIGRIAFPIFSFLIVQGYLHTSDIKKYSLRLLSAAFISEIPFNLFVYHKIFCLNGQNVIFTLFLGLVAIWAIDKHFDRHKFIVTGFVALCCSISYIIKSDYGVFGVLLIVSLFVFYKNKLLYIIMFILLNCGFSLAENIYVQCAASLAAVPMYFYNGQLGKYKLKWLFYLFYPLHMLVLYYIWFFTH